MLGREMWIPNFVPSKEQLETLVSLAHALNTLWGEEKVVARFKLWSLARSRVQKGLLFEIYASNAAV